MKKIIILITILLMAILTTLQPAYANPPTISGPDVVFKQASSIITINDIILLYEMPNHYIMVGNDEYTGNGATVGTYNVSIIATDGINDIIKPIKVKVLSNLGDVTLVGDGNIYVRPDQVLNFDKIRRTLTNVNHIHISVGTGYQIITDTYTGNESTPGVYNYAFKLVSASGNIQNVQIKIYVSDDFTQFVHDEIIPADPSPIDNMLGGAWSFILDGIFIVGIVIVVYFVWKLFIKKKKVI